MQQYVSQASQDIFADFYGDAQPAKEQSKKPEIKLKGDIDELKPQAISFYIKEGAPIMALSSQQSNEQAQHAYYFELYKLGG